MPTLDKLKRFAEIAEGQRIEAVRANLLKKSGVIHFRLELADGTELDVMAGEDEVIAALHEAKKKPAPPDTGW